MILRVFKKMMPATCHNLEFGRTAFVDFAACGCSFNSSFDRFSLRNYAIRSVSRAYGGGGGGRRLICCRRDGGVAKRRVFSTEAPETLLNGDSPGPPAVLSEKKESTADLFEVVADDLLTLNKNLQSIVGAENPVLMSAAEQIFSAGGKRMRPALVFLVSRATLELTGLEELTREHRRLAEIIEMIHTASLIHDDVLDESDMRRGKTFKYIGMFHDF